MATVSYYGKLWSGDVDSAVRIAAEKTKRFGLARVKAKTPVKSGQLRKGWKASVEGEGILFYNNVPYSGYVEYGTKRMAPRHMLTDSLPEITVYFQRELGKAIGNQLGMEVFGEYSK